MSKILFGFGSFLAFFQKNEIWPYLVEFGIFLKVIWLCACAKAYQPCGTACLPFSKQIFVFLLSAPSCVVFNQLSRYVQEKAI
jgi:hypothetical protein